MKRRSFASSSIESKKMPAGGERVDVRQWREPSPLEVDLHQDESLPMMVQ